jgi:hypothetical protein
MDVCEAYMFVMMIIVCGRGCKVPKESELLL